MSVINQIVPQQNQQAPQVINIYHHMSTNNKSFLNMHYYLKTVGIKNNAFMLLLLDPDLAAIDPRDPRLNRYMKAKVLKETKDNYWYFLREIVRIPQQGAAAGSGVMYELHRGNMALNYCLAMNINIFEEQPRQTGKTIGTIVRYVWVYQWGATNSEILFGNKKHEDSKLNLSRFRDIRDALPDYLVMTDVVGPDGKKMKAKSNVESLEHLTNGNKIKTLASAKNKIMANSLGRGMTIPILWLDEFAFIPHNGILYNAASPAWKTAAMNAASNNSPYGICITTTPGDLTTPEGVYAWNFKENATPWNEKMYDMHPAQLWDIVNSNQRSNFIYIKYDFRQLGRSEKWFREICITMQNVADDIRREVLLEWSSAASNSPFNKEDLILTKTLLKQPEDTIFLLGKYQFRIYDNKVDLRHPPIIGVDVASGTYRDASAITIIDSRTTKVIADFSSNSITTGDLAVLIHTIVKDFMPNAIVNVERNGGFGHSVLQKLLTTSIRQNLYFEIKDRIVEERTNNIGQVSRKTQKTKVFGFDSTGNSRELLIQILRERMDLHKDKFISPYLFAELETLEVKRNGRVEHVNSGHDDQVFSYLMAMYVWYEGKNLQDYGIVKGVLKTDQDAMDAIIDIEEPVSDVIQALEDTEGNERIQEQLERLDTKSKLYSQWEKDEWEKEQLQLDRLLATDERFRKAYSQAHNVEVKASSDGKYSMPSDIFDNFNGQDEWDDNDQ